MKEYVSAKEAKEMTISVVNGIMEEELKTIYDDIFEAIREGKSSITYNNASFCKSTLNYLKNKGYKVDHFTGCQWDPANDTIISWA